MDVYLVASEIKVGVLLRGLRIFEGLTYILQSEVEVLSFISYIGMCRAKAYGF